MTARRDAVLYVDDEESNLAAFRYCFEDRFNVLTAASGEEALGVLRERPVAVLVADQRMPRMSGAELCARARALAPDTVRMALTAYADIGTAIAAINEGRVSRYVLKPWDEAEMQAALQAAVDSYELSVLVAGLQSVLPIHQQEAGAATALRIILHELSNPATAVLSTVTFMGETMEALVRAMQPAPAGAVALAAELQRAAADGLEGCRELTRRLKCFRDALGARNLTAALGGQTVAEPEGAEVRPVVESTAAVLRREISRRAALELELAPVPRVAMSPMRLSLVLMNLLLNAMEAIAPGRPADNRIRVTAARTGDQVAVEVTDTGAGIPADQLARVYDPYFSTKATGVVRGLGLAVTRDLARSAGGDVSARSEVGRGSSFTLLVPIAEGRS